MTAVIEDVRICAEEGCEEALAPDAHPFQRYCPAHAKGARPKTKRPRGRPRKETPPKMVFDINSKPPSESAQQKRVYKSALFLFSAAGTGIAMMGDLECAEAVKNGAPELAAALAELSKYQPIIAKILTPTSSSDQAAAWAGLAVAALPVLIPILAHHNLIPAKIGVMMGGAFVGLSGDEGDSDGDD